MVSRQYNKNRYLAAFVITAVVFTLGLLLGSFLSTEREEVMRKANELQKIEFESLQLQSLLLATQENKEACSGILEALEQSLTKLEQTRAKLESYILDERVENHDTLKHDYMLAEIRYWFFTQKTQETCKENRATILYFYSNTEGACDDCATQGLILTALKEKYRERLLIFSVDGDYHQEPMINILKELYEIKEYPSLVINEKPYHGLQELETVEKVICDVYLKNCNNEG